MVYLYLKVDHCIGEVNLEDELRDKDINTPPMKRSAEFHIPSPELPLRKVNKLTEVEELKTEEPHDCTASSVEDSEKENIPHNVLEASLISEPSPMDTESSLSPSTLPAIKPVYQSKLRQPSKRIPTDQASTPIEYVSEIK